MASEALESALILMGAAIRPNPINILVTFMCGHFTLQLQHFHHSLKSAPSTYKILPFLRIRHGECSKTLEELEYATCEITEASIQKNARQQGYAVARNKLYNDKKGEFRRRTFRCAMGRKYEDLATQRTTSSRMTSCEFACDAIRIIGKKGERWKVSVSNPALGPGRPSNRQR